MSPSPLTTDHDACGVGLVAKIGGVASREIVDRALEALIRLAHRGGVDADGRSGDGAGLLTRIPDKLIRKQAATSGIKLPAVYGLGMVFLPPAQAEATRDAIEAQARRSGLKCLGWRTVPTNPEVVGPRAYEAPCPSSSDVSSLRNQKLKIWNSSFSISARKLRLSLPPELISVHYPVEPSFTKVC